MANSGVGVEVVAPSDKADDDAGAGDAAGLSSGKLSAPRVERASAVHSTSAKVPA